MYDKSQSVDHKKITEGLAFFSKKFLWFPWNNGQDWFVSQWAVKIPKK